MPSLHNALTAAILDSPQSTIAVDLGAVESLDDVALEVLLGAAGRERRGGGDLVIITADEALRQRLALTRFDRAISRVTLAVADVVASHRSVTCQRRLTLHRQQTLGSEDSEASGVGGGVDRLV